jgi:hypothetical protein
MVFVGARNPNNRQFRFLNVVGRLAEGADLERARTELEAVSAALTEEYPEAKTGWSARVDPLLETQIAEARPALVVLLASVGLLLLIALGNVAVMFLIRASAHRASADHREPPRRRRRRCGGPRNSGLHDSGPSELSR